MKRKIHKGDTVKVITGSDKGIIGEVLEERFQIEDNLIEKMHNVHREAVAS